MYEEGLTKGLKVLNPMSDFLYIPCTVWYTGCSAADRMDFKKVSRENHWLSSAFSRRHRQLMMPQQGQKHSKGHFPYTFCAPTFWETLQKLQKAEQTD